MKYAIVEAKLKTNKTRSYLWNKINSPKKIIKIEEFKNAKIKKISDNNYVIKAKNYHVLVTFVPKKGVNQVFIGVKNYPMTWFEIKGERNCTIVHGEYKRTDSGMDAKKFKKELIWVKKHFLAELREIAK